MSSIVWGPTFPPRKLALELLTGDVICTWDLKEISAA